MCKRISVHSNTRYLTLLFSLIKDEIQEFATNCILNPPGPRKPKQLNGYRKAVKHRAQALENGPTPKRARLNGKPKIKANGTTRNVTLAKLRKMQNGIAKQTIEMDDATLKLAFESVLPADILQNGTDMADEINVTSSTPNVSPSIKQKVKYIPPDQFVHLKPPPMNTQKIYVKHQNGNSQSYTLGVKNIGSSNIPVINNKLITVQKDLTNQINVSMNEEDTIQSATEENNTSMGNIDMHDIFDIPILFADDGNAADESKSSIESPKITDTSQPPKSSRSTKSANTIEILSDTIIKAAANGKFLF